MKQSFIRAGVAVACAAILLTGSLAYAQFGGGEGGSTAPASPYCPDVAYVSTICDSLASTVDSLASSFGFTSANQTSGAFGGYLYNTDHEGMNATYSNAQGDTLTINYCDNGAYVATTQTTCSSAPNSCGMTGTGYITTVNSAEGQVASSQSPCSAVTPSDSLCPTNRSPGGGGTVCPDGSAPAGPNGGCTCRQGNLNACAKKAICPDGSAAPGGDATACTCAQGNTTACISSTPPSPIPGVGDTGPNGCLTENGSCVLTCDVGYTQEGSQCVFSGCPVGYSQSGSQCTFVGCPDGYTQEGAQCVFVGCTAGYICKSGNQYYVNSSCDVSSAPTQSCSYGCSGGACSPPPAPQIATWQVNPTLVESGETTSIEWQSQNVASCAVTGSNGDSWTGVSGTQTSAPILGQTIFTIICQGLSGSSPASASEATTVNIVPSFDEH